MIDETMRAELKDVLDQGYMLSTGYMDGDADHFYFYLFPPDGNRKNGIYGNMQRTKRMTPGEIAFAASYYLLGALEGRGKLNMEKVTT